MNNGTEFSEIVTGLISNLFQPNSDQIDENTSLTLTFMFPEIYLKSLDILDKSQIQIYKYSATVNKDDLLFGDDSTVVIDLEDPCYVDLQQWFCSCSAFQLRLKATSMDHESQRTEGYGYRDGELPQFDNIPVCQHLLACYILRTHPSQLHTAYTLKSYNSEDLLALHSKLNI